MLDIPTPLNSIEEDPRFEQLVAQMKTLTPSMRKRVRALKKLQRQEIDIEVDYCRRLGQLDVEFGPRFAVLNEERRKIVTGELEPSSDEAANFQTLQGLSRESDQRLDEDGNPEPEGGTVGLPNFWLTVLKNAFFSRGLIKAYDEPILKHLVDISVEVHTDPSAFTLSFHFAPNEYFEEAVLKKKYFLKDTPDEESPFTYEGSTLLRAEGSNITWKEGMDVTKKFGAMAAESRADSGEERRGTKSVRAESFFNFFRSSAESDSDSDSDESDSDASEEKQLMRLVDYDMGQFLREMVIPRAVLFYTGEHTSDDEEEEVEDELKCHKWGDFCHLLPNDESDEQEESATED